MVGGMKVMSEHSSEELVSSIVSKSPERSDGSLISLDETVPKVFRAQYKSDQVHAKTCTACLQLGRVIEDCILCSILGTQNILKRQCVSGKIDSPL